MSHQLLKVAIAAAVLSLVTPASSEDRFGPDNPWFNQFEDTCREGMKMHPDCQTGVLGAYAEYAGTDNVSCDFSAFWRVRDERYNTKVFDVLPWQYGVEAIVQTDGVCSEKN